MVRYLLLLAACQGGGSDAPRVERARDASVPHEPGFGNHDAAITADAVVVEEEPAPDSNKTIIRLGALPAWQAVVDRTRYLSRREQHGVVFGTIATAESPYTWLVDDTEGNGALGIRAALGMKGAKDGDRVALAGAWKLDDQRRWFWGVETLTVLPPAASSDAPKDPRAAQPTHAIANGELPNGARTIGVAKDGDAAYFTVVGGTPTVDGDGWLVADELGNPPVAAMTFPGERASYGAQDMRTADERWQLRRGQTYWVRLGHFHKHGDKLQTVTARTAPIRVK